MPQAGLGQKFDCIARYKAQEGLSRSGHLSSMGPCVKYEYSTFQQEPLTVEKWDGSCRTASSGLACSCSFQCGAQIGKPNVTAESAAAQSRVRGPCLPGFAQAGIAGRMNTPNQK